MVHVPVGTRSAAAARRGLARSSASGARVPAGGRPRRRRTCASSRRSPCSAARSSLARAGGAAVRGQAARRARRLGDLGARARALYEFGHPVAPVFTDPLYPALQHPLLLPALEAIDFRFMGAFDGTAVHLQLLGLAVGFVGGAWTLLGGYDRPLLLAATLLALVCAPTFFNQLQTNYADMPLAMFVALGVAALATLAADRRARGCFPAAALFLAAGGADEERGRDLRARRRSSPRWRCRARGQRRPLLLAARRGRRSPTCRGGSGSQVEQVKIAEYSISNLFDPSYLADHADRVGPSVHELLRADLDGRELELPGAAGARSRSSARARLRRFRLALFGDRLARCSRSRRWSAIYWISTNPVASHLDELVRPHDRQPRARRRRCSCRCSCSTRTSRVRMLHAMIRGAFAAALTPLRLTAGRRSTRTPVAPYATLLADGGVDGMLACGTTGEGILLSAGRAPPRGRSCSSRPRAGRLAVAVHCGAQTTAETAALAAHAAEAGAAAVAVIGAAVLPARRRRRSRRTSPPRPPRARRCRSTSTSSRRGAATRCPSRSSSGCASARRTCAASRSPTSRGRRSSRTCSRGWTSSSAPSRSSRAGSRSGAAGAVSGLAAVYPEVVAALVREPTQERSRRGRAAACGARPIPVPGGREGRRGAARGADPTRRARAASHADPRRAGGARPAVILVAGAGAMGAGIAYRLARDGADVVLCDRGRSHRARRRARWAASGSSSRPRRRCGSRRRASRSSPSSGRRSSTRSATSSSRPPRRGSPRSRSVGSSRRASACRSSASIPRSSRGSRRGDVLGAVFCAQDGVADPPAVARELVRRAVALGVELREHTLAESLLDQADTARDRLRALVRRAGAARRRRAPDPAALPPAPGDRVARRRRRRCCRWSSRRRPASTSAAAATGSCSPCPTRSRAGPSRRPSTSPSSTTASPVSPTGSRRPRARDRRSLGGPLRHDARRPPDPRARRRRRLCRLRVLGARIHAVAGRRSGDRRGDPRRRLGARPGAVPPRPVRGASFRSVVRRRSCFSRRDGRVERVL